MSEKKVILYVDDEPFNLMILANVFEKKYTIITAESGHEGLEKLSNNPAISIIISDMKMPGMNGVEFIRKAKTKCPHISCFILTGCEIVEEISNALEEKLILKYFSKPFNKQNIEQAIEELK